MKFLIVVLSKIGVFVVIVLRVLFTSTVSFCFCRRGTGSKFFIVGLAKLVFFLLATADGVLQLLNCVFIEFRLLFEQ